MPQRKSAKKELHADKKKKKRNLLIKRKVKRTTKDYLKALSQNNTEQAEKSLAAVYKELDKAAAKNYFHKNKTNRKKSRLAKKIKSAS
jgi:small subunit ribosomal protein S20